MNDTDRLARAIFGTIECAYCNRDVLNEGEYVPDVTDDEQWERLAEEHNEECEWIATRAHRL